MKVTGIGLLYKKTEVLTSGVFTPGDLHDIPPAGIMMGAAQSPGQSDTDPAGPGSTSRLLELIQTQQHEDTWRKEVLNLLTQLVQIQTEAAKQQAQVVDQLGTLGTQASPALAWL